MVQVTLAVAATLITSVARVSAHGYVEKITVGANLYTGYLPYEDPYHTPAPPRAVRKIPGNGPVEDVSSIDVQCNGWTAGGSPGSAPAALTIPAAAGSTVSLKWTSPWPDSHMGPIITYMARAPSDITKWSPGTAAVWFKVDEKGRSADGKWAATDVLIPAGEVTSFKIPASLKAGQYIVRHEIIALHAAYSYPGAQVYPSCIQFEITGSGTKFPTSGLVSFPGAYSSATPGIVFNAYQNGAYPIPGPAVWNGN